MGIDSPIPIAIVGLSCRFPGGANNPELLWDMLVEGRDGWTDVPADRYNWKAFYHPNPEARGAHNSRGGHFIDQDISEFDPLFFGLSSEEASSLDPQQRFQLMTVYEALENSGIPIESVRGSDTSVYIAVVSRDYDRMVYKDPSDIPKHHLTGCGDATVCGRISYTFDLRGPSVTIDTGCSGSMVGLHQACQGLRLGETSMAIVGGTNLLLGPDMTIAMSMLHMLNDNGKCYSFDSRGSGYGRSEGVATIILKRLDDALAAGDPIRAIIRNTGINQDGKTNGILLPSSESQEILVRSLYKSIKLNPSEVGYVEAHGTGTAAGDAAEIESISKVFCSGSSRETPLFVGSIKANIGHLESASGLAGIIKTVMALEQGIIPPVPNVLRLKESVESVKNKIEIPQNIRKWPNGGVQYASINSFGFGGTNTHCILQSPPNKVTEVNNFVNEDINGHPAPAHIINQTNGNHSDQFNKKYLKPRNFPLVFVLSAKSKQSLLGMTNKLRAWLSKRTAQESLLADLAFTLATRRSKLVWRASYVAESANELFKTLESPHSMKSHNTPRTIFIFTGQGGQWAGMASEFLGSPIFGHSLSRSAEILKMLGAPWDLLEELRRSDNDRINSSSISQPATTAIQIALVDTLRAFNLYPNAVLGHSSGEVAAAYACGILSHASAIKVAYFRGFASRWYREVSVVKGAMLAVGCGESDSELYISRLQSNHASVACQNSPTSTTISGSEESIEELQTLLNKDKIFNRRLKVDIAYHSFQMDAIASRYLESLGNLETVSSDRSTKFFSSVTGKEKQSDFGASYWVENLTSRVRFSDALHEIIRFSDSSHSLIELGPHSALQGPIRQSLASLGIKSQDFPYFPTLIREKDARRSVLELAGKLFEHGYALDLALANSICSDQPPHAKKVLTDLPPYSWDLTKHWHESRLSRDYRFRSHPYHDLLGLRVVGSTPIEPSWRNILSVDTLPWLHDHIIDGFALFPGSGFLCMAIEALRQITQDRTANSPVTISKYILKDITFSKALIIPDSPRSVEVILSLTKSKQSSKALLKWESFHITSLGKDGVWNDHCQGRIAYEVVVTDDDITDAQLEDNQLSSQAVERLENMKRACVEHIDNISFYKELREINIDYGKTFSTIRSLSVGPLQAVARMVIPDVAKVMPASYLEPHVIHPATFDALMHVALPLYSRNCSHGPAMLIAIDEVVVSADIARRPGEELSIACNLTRAGPLSGVVNVSVLQNNSGTSNAQVLTLTGQSFRGIGESQIGNRVVDFAQKRCFETSFVDFESSESEQSVTQSVVIIYDNDSDLETLAQDLTDILGGRGVEVVMSTSYPKVVYDTSIYVILQSTAKIAADSSPKALHFLQEARLAFYVSLHGSEHSDLISSNSYQTHETALSERRPPKNSRSVFLEGFEVDFKDSHFIESVAAALLHSFSDLSDGSVFERNYYYLTNKLKVPRLAHAKGVVEQVTRNDGTEAIGMDLLKRDNKHLRLHIQTPGLLDSFIFVEDESYINDLKDDEIEVEIAAQAINQLDVVIAMGRLSLETSMINEISGTVSAVGQISSTRFKVGDRVCGWGGSGYGSRSRINHLLAHKLPRSISFVEGASIPYAFQTAYYALVEIGELEQSKSVLIHSAFSAVGQAAIAIARQAGAQIFATVSDKSASRREDYAVKLGIPASNIFSKSSDAFRKGILRLTKGQGVDIALISSSSLIQDTCDCVADFGYIINLSTSRDETTLRAAKQNVTFSSIDMLTVAKRKPAKIAKIFGQVMKMITENKAVLCQPQIIMPMTDIALGFRLIQQKKHAGKVILTVADDVKVPQISVTKFGPLLAPNKSYVILGDEPKMIKLVYRYLRKHGARSIAIIASDTIPYEALIEAEVSSFGVRVKLYTCDVYEKANLNATLAQLKEDNFSFSGIIQIHLKILTAAIIDVDTYNLDFHINATTASNLDTQHDISLLHIESIRRPNLTFIQRTLSQDELFIVLDYMLKAPPSKTANGLLIVGYEQNQLVRQDSHATDPYYSQLRISEPVFPTSESARKGSKAIGDEGSLEEAESSTARIVTRKLSSLVAIDEDDVDLSSPLAEIGLDSLVAIDFKNWIGRTFVAPMQTSEILDASSIIELSKLIVNRSDLVTTEKRSTWSHNATSNMTKDQPATDAKAYHSYKKEDKVTISTPKLPMLPLPEMETVLQGYLNMTRAFCSNEQFAFTYDAVNEFQRPGGLGRKLHARLAQIANDPGVDCWLEDLYVRSNFLDRRVQLVPFGNFFFTHKMSPFPHSQSERAAIIASSVFRYQQMLEADELPVQYVNELPVCTYLNQWLFNATRRPQLISDTMHKFSSTEYFITLCKGRVFKIALRQNSQNITEKQLRATFEAILRLVSGGSMKRIGILTADERTSWAKMRTMIQEISDRNATYLATIDAAAFLICLDSAAPTSAKERARHYHFGDGFNRWNDKSLQFPICSNGISGMIGDHTMIDAGTVFGLNAFVTKAIMNHEKIEEPDSADENYNVELDEYPIEMNDVIENRIRAVQDDLLRNTETIEHEFFNFENFGEIAMRSVKCAPKSAFQVIAMMASYEHFGCLEPCWETASLSQFHKGRVELAQGLVPPVAEFLVSVNDTSLSIENKRKLFLEAAKAHASVITKATRFRGFDRYLSAIRQVLRPEDGPVALFADPTYTRTRPRKFMSHTHETGMLEQGFQLRDPDAIWLHYTVEDNCVRWCVCGHVGQTGKFRILLENAAATVKEILGL